MRFNQLQHRCAFGFILALSLLPGRTRAEDDPSLKLVPQLDVLLNIVKGKTSVYTLHVDATLPAFQGKISLTIGRDGERRYFLNLNGPRDIRGTFVLTPDKVFVELPAKNIAFVADSPLGDSPEPLNPEEILKNLPRLNTIATMAWPMVKNSDGRGLIGAIAPILKIAKAEKPGATAGADYLTLKPGATAFDLEIQNGKWTLSWGENRVEISQEEKCKLPELSKDVKTVSVPRAEFERVLQRGALRAIDIKVDDFYSEKPADKVVEIEGARLEIKDGQRTCWLTGTPYDMGYRHGKLLAPEIRKMTDSTLYCVGMAYSVMKGSWFLNDIRSAWARLEPHCNKEYLEELQGLAEGSDIAYDEMKIANVFPELFHCSGFAVSGDATVGGKLYHGRVLDYMTEIGLQNAQVDFITRRDGAKGFVNIGYAGFIGCVSGMNEAQISLGEMGGRGEGNWDGTPMAFLMRLVLEKAGTLDEARNIFANAKRTCEYYYVIADGKSRTSLGVAAWPEKIQFLKQGEPHEKLPNSFKDCVLLSAGDRYKLLCERCKDSFGKIDEQGALDLMKRPVSMGSNLHSVLFVPEDQTYWVAHASLKGHQAAATQPYVKHDLKENLKKLDEVKKAKTASAN